MHVDTGNSGITIIGKHELYPYPTKSKIWRKITSSFFKTVNQYRREMHPKKHFLQIMHNAKLSHRTDVLRKGFLLMWHAVWCWHLSKWMTNDSKESMLCKWSVWYVLNFWNKTKTYSNFSSNKFHVRAVNCRVWLNNTCIQLSTIFTGFGRNVLAIKSFEILLE